MKFDSLDHELRELQLSRALGDLSPESDAALRHLEGGSEPAPDDYELAATAVYLAFRSFSDVMPTGLRQRLEEEGLDILASYPN